MACLHVGAGPAKHGGKSVNTLLTRVTNRLPPAADASTYALQKSCGSVEIVPQLYAILFLLKRMMPLKSKMAMREKAWVLQHASFVLSYHQLRAGKRQRG